MNIVLFTMSICCFLMGMFFLFAKWAGSSTPVLIFICRIIGLFGVLTPIFYWLVLLGILNK